MPRTAAAQHLYTNVEEAQSPRGRGGFQTLFYTHRALTESEVSELEGRLPYFPSAGAPVKRLFFLLTTGKVVVGQVVPLAKADSAGRKGRYLAHSLVFEREDFVRGGADPFAVFDGFRFATTVEDALKRGDFDSGNVDPTAVELSGKARGADKAAEGWEIAELSKLVQLALQARELAAQRTPVAFVGSPTEAEQALRAAWFALPSLLRPQCSFDTYFYRCNLVATYYWGVGLLDDPANPNLPLVRAGQAQVEKSDLAEPATSYERWALETLAGEGPAHIEAHRDGAYALAEFLDGREHEDLLGDVAPPLVGSVFSSNSAQVRARVRGRIGEALPERLTDRVLEAAEHALDASEKLARLRAGFSVEELLDALYRAYEVSAFARPDGHERDELRDVLSRHGDDRLAPLLALWSRDRRKIAEALANLDDAGYGRAVDLALRHDLADPWLMLLAGRGEAFVARYFRSVPAEAWELAELAEALLDTENADCLPTLARRLHELDDRELRRLHAVVDEDHRVPEPFREKVAAAVAALSPPGGIRGLFRKVLRR